MCDWMAFETAPKDGTEFQAWMGHWEPRCRINPDTEAFEIWGRIDYDADGWDTYPHLIPTHWMPEPRDPVASEAAMKALRRELDEMSILSQKESGPLN